MPDKPFTLRLHLLKGAIAGGHEVAGLVGNYSRAARRIEKLLRESPSLRPFVAETLSEAYAEAREDALEETGLPEADFPAECPFSPDEVLSRSFLPER